MVHITYAGVSAQEVATLVEAAVAEVIAYAPPVGSIMPWLPDYANTPALPSGWVECNGQVLDDEESVYDTQTIPDLNGDNRFLRGAAASGGTGGQETLDLAHVHTIPSENLGTSSWTAPVGKDGNSGSALADATDIQPPFYNVVWIMRVK